MADDRIYRKISFTERNTIWLSWRSFNKHSCTQIDILRAINKGDSTLAGLADYSKAFDIEDYYILITKLHRLNFSKKSITLDG